MGLRPYVGKPAGGKVHNLNEIAMVWIFRWGNSDPWIFFCSNTLAAHRLRVNQPLHIRNALVKLSMCSWVWTMALTFLDFIFYFFSKWSLDPCFLLGNEEHKTKKSPLDQGLLYFFCFSPKPSQIRPISGITTCLLPGNNIMTWAAPLVASRWCLHQEISGGAPKCNDTSGDNFSEGLLLAGLAKERLALVRVSWRWVGDPKFGLPK